MEAGGGFSFPCTPSIPCRKTRGAFVHPRAVVMKNNDTPRASMSEELQPACLSAASVQLSLAMWGAQLLRILRI